MKNIKYSVIAVICIMNCSYSEVKSQVSTLGNFSNSSTDYVGWDSNVLTFPLQIRHDANQSILFSTNATERMRLMEYGNFGVGIDVGVRPKFMSFLDNGNASLLEEKIFVSTAIYGHKLLNPIRVNRYGALMTA